MVDRTRNTCGLQSKSGSKPHVGLCRKLSVLLTTISFSIFAHFQQIKAMVVVHAQPSTSATTTQKKNRRKLHKKAANAAQNDAEMDESTPQSGEARDDDDDELMIDDEHADVPLDASAPAFPPLSAAAQRSTLKSEIRRIPIPPHRMTPLKKDWVNVFGPLTEILGLQVRMNVQRKCVEIRVCWYRIFACVCSINILPDIKTHQRDRSTAERS